MAISPPPCFLLFVFSTCFLFFLTLHRVLLRCLFSSGRSYSFYGPKTYPVIGCLLPFHRNRRRLLDWYTELLAASPTQTIVIERLGARRTVVTANPDNVERVLKSNFPNYPKGRPFTDVLGDLLGCGIFNADGELWHAQRKLASHEFSARSLREFVLETLESEARERLLPALASACADARVVDMQDLLRRFAFDAICRVALGTDPRYLDASMPRSELADSFEVASGISAVRATAPIATVWKVKRALGVGSERTLRGAVKLIHRLIMELIQKRKKEMEKGEGRNDLLTRLIAGGHSDEVVRDMVISFVIAGKDTTSAALTWFFWLIQRHPDAEREVVEEARRFEGRLDYQALKEMRVLEACLCETMRLYPPVVWDSKHAVARDVLPDGTLVEKGDRVTYFPYGMGRMERLWGKSCGEFDHRRWLSESGELERASPYKFSVFQAGPRACLGKEMAFVQMKYVAAAVLGKFEMRWEEAGRESRLPVLVPMLTAHMAGGLRVVVEERQGIWTTLLLRQTVFL
ncbi:Cytochrome P450 [Canna indica]|uniref:Cytochrome P450 n=1 Tax=Canna indica TaxID=4628 RepID=A0AAQ3QFY4_9LILI|nr:Cytochrome P450 [Canna indica]